MKSGPGDAEAPIGGFADGGQNCGDTGGLRGHAAGRKPEEPRGGQRLGPKGRRSQVLYTSFVVAAVAHVLLVHYAYGK